jgi:hypothetical protein
VLLVKKKNKKVSTRVAWRFAGTLDSVRWYFTLWAAGWLVMATCGTPGIQEEVYVKHASVRLSEDLGVA